MPKIDRTAKGRVRQHDVARERRLTDGPLDSSLHLNVTAGIDRNLAQHALRLPHARSTSSCSTVSTTHPVGGAWRVPRTTSMHCPKCGKVLVDKVQGGVHMFACPQNEGAWLEASALESLLKK